jgi:putative DNA primase/helicase
MDNYASVVHQMEAFGVEFTSRDLPLVIPTPKRKTCGVKGKWWYWLQLWRPRRPDGAETGAEYVVGKFGTYKHGGSDAKVEIDFKPLTEAERERFRVERRAAEEKSRAAKEQAAQQAALGAAELWRQGTRAGQSEYLERKGVVAESCRFVAQPTRLRRRDPAKPPFFLPAGTLMIPLLRYDAERATALRGLQLIKPDGFKIYSEDLAKTGCAVRLGNVDEDTGLVLVCEGYATGLSIRMGTDRQVPVYVALDAYNLVFVVEILRRLHPKAHLLICADDDWKTADQDGSNPGRTKAKLAAKTTERCDLVWPVFNPATREVKDTDFNDLHLREGLAAVSRQLGAVVSAMRRRAA